MKKYCYQCRHCVVHKYMPMSECTHPRHKHFKGQVRPIEINHGFDCPLWEPDITTRIQTWWRGLWKR